MEAMFVSDRRCTSVSEELHLAFEELHAAAQHQHQKLMTTASQPFSQDFGPDYRLILETAVGGICNQPASNLRDHVFMFCDVLRKVMRPL